MVADAQGVSDADRRVRGAEFGVLGDLEVRVRGTDATLGGPKQRGVLAVLIAAAGRPVSVDALLIATYGDDARPGTKATLHTYVSNLRKALGDVIVRRGDAYLLDCSDATIDAAAFEDLCVGAAGVEDPERVASTLRQALALWRGQAYAGIEANGHLDGEITRLSEMRLAALESRIDADMRTGRHREVVGELDALTAEYPYRESLRALHMIALYRCGRQAEALRAYARTREQLVEDLGIDPSPELKDLERRVLAQDRDLLVHVRPTVQYVRSALDARRSVATGGAVLLGGTTADQQLPPALELLADPATYVGRSQERSQLRELWRRAEQGKMLVAVVLGEAGMGKSRIVAELAAEVHAAGGQVRLGSCLEELGIPYEPFVQIVDSDAVSMTETEFAERVGSGAPVLARLSPNVASRLELAAPGSAAAGPVERAEIFATLRDYLDRSARQAPLLVVIEDLHWSTASTRDSLRFLARLGSATPALLVLTSRDSAPDLDDALAGFLAELGRQPCVEVINLSALTEDDVAGLLAVTGRGRPAEEVYAATGGNPLLALEASNSDHRVNSVSSLLSARFDRLAPAEMELLDVAVVIGSTFHTDLVAAAAGRDLGSVLEALESAEDAGLIASDPREPLRFSFVHALFRTVRYDSMRTSTRLRLHAAVAAVLRPRADDERVLPILAHHACAAAPLGHVEDAVMLARSAGHLARRRRGYDEAAEQYERALALLELIPSAAASRLGLLLRVDLATALFDGGRPAGWPLLQAAIEEARQRADDEALANATIALSGVISPSSGRRVNHDVAAMFSEALDRVPAEPSPLRARLLVGLSGHLDPDDLLRARELARAAIDMARGLGDLSAVGDGLMTYRWLIWEPALASERVAVGEELISLGRRLDDPKFTTGGLSQLLQVNREAGDLVAAERVRAEMEALSALRPHPVTQAIVITYHATEQYLAGDLAAAEATAETLLEFGNEQGVDSWGLYALIISTIRYQQGRTVELLPQIEQAVAEQPNHRRSLAVMLARALARAGRLNDAAEVVHGLAVHNYDLPHNGQWFPGTEQLADAVEILGDTAVAAILRERLTPFAGRIANSSPGVTRPADQALAQLALVLGDLDGAAADATRAIAASRTRKTPIFLGRELVLLATARQRVGAPEGEIMSLVEEAQQIADATGAHLINQEITRYGLSPAHSAPDHSEYPDSP